MLKIVEILRQKNKQKLNESMINLVNQGIIKLFQACNAWSLQKAF